MYLKLKLYYLQVGIYFILSLKSVHNLNIKCELKCTKWDFVCTKPVPKKNYSPNPLVACTPSDYPRYPKSSKEVADIVKEAIKKGVPVRAFGNLLSLSDSVCTEGIPMGIGGLQSFRMNSDKTVTASVGVNIYDLTEFLRENNRALRTIPILANMTLGGAILTGEHGNSLHLDASLSSQVLEMTIVNSKGELQVISCPEELKAFSLSLGLLGIVVDVTLKTVELQKMKVHNYIAKDDILTNGEAVKCAEKNDECALYWFPSSKEVVVSKKNFVNVTEPGDAVSNEFLASISSNLAKVMNKAKEIAFGLTESTCAAANSLGYTFLTIIEDFLKSSLIVQTPECPPIYTEDGSTVKNPAVGFSNKMSSRICYNNPKDTLAAACPNSHGENSLTSLDTEFSIDLRDLPAFVKTVKDIQTKTPTILPLQGFRITFSGKSQIYLSTAYGRKTVNIEYLMWIRKELFKGPSASLAAFQTISQFLTVKLKGRSNWGKSGLVFHDSESLDKKLESRARKAFTAAMKKYDEDGVFVNKLGLRIARKGTKVNMNPEQVHCALLDSCICTTNTDCGPSQICTTLTGYTYRVCKTKNEEAECIVDRSGFPALGDVIKYLKTDVPQLAADVLDKCS